MSPNITGNVFKRMTEMEAASTSEATPATLVKRDANGTFKVSQATDAAHPVRDYDLQLSRLEIARETGSYHILGVPQPTLDLRAYDYKNEANGAHPAMSVTRASSAMSVNKFGLLESVGTDVLRHDYDPVTGKYLGWLIEGAATNLLTYSQKFDTRYKITLTGVSGAFQVGETITGGSSGSTGVVTDVDGSVLGIKAQSNTFTAAETITGATSGATGTYLSSVNVWFIYRGSVTAGATTAPDGTTTASKFVESTDTGAHHIYQTFTVAANTTVTASCFCKAAERSRISLSIFCKDSSYKKAHIDLATGEEISTDPGYTAKIEEFPDGWYRCSITGSVLSGAETPRFHIFLSNGSTDSYTGDGTSGVYIWGAQVEEGYHPSSYIKTTSATVTRAADVVTISGAEFSGFYNQSEGTFVVQASRDSVSGSIPHIAFEISDGTNNNVSAAVFVEVGSRNLWAHTREGGVSTSNFNSGVDFPTGETTVAFGYRANDCFLAYNNVGVSSASPTTIPTAVNLLSIGCGRASTSFWAGTIRSLTYFPKRITNAKLQLLSTQTGDDNV